MGMTALCISHMANTLNRNMKGNERQIVCDRWKETWLFPKVAPFGQQKIDGAVSQINTPYGTQHHTCLGQNVATILPVCSRQTITLFSFKTSLSLHIPWRKVGQCARRNTALRVIKSWRKPAEKKNEMNQKIKV